MIIDKLLKFSEKQSFTGSAATDADEVVKFMSDAPIGPGRSLWVVVQIDEALSGSSAYKVQLVTGSTNTPATVIATADLPTAKGERLIIGMPYTNDQYLGLKYSAANTSGTTGKITAWLTDQEPQFWIAHAEGAN